MNGGGDGAVAAYRAFLEAKVCKPGRIGFTIADHEVNPILKGHQRAAVRWMVAGGRRACFAAFGLGKSVIQLEAVRLTRERAGGRGLIVLPLGVRQEFTRDAGMLGIAVKFIRRIEEAPDDPSVICLTNYETVRDGKLDPAHFTVVSLDEASCLRGFGGTKTFREFMRLFGADGAPGGTPYRYLATATPAPNEFIELLAYAAFLDVMDVGQAKTRFFRRNSEKADQLTLHPHKEREFWLWLASWGLFIQRPSDLGYSDEGYALPPLKVVWHKVAADPLTGPAVEKSGQVRMFKDASRGVVEAARDKRESLGPRIDRMLTILSEAPRDHFILWHDLEAEREAIETVVPGVRSVWGSQDLDERERTIIEFSDGGFQHLAAKPVIAGSGCNFQRHCRKAIFVGIGFKFNDFIQAVHRLYRFLQAGEVEVHIIYAESEAGTRDILLEKWRNHEELTRQMSEIIRQYGLADAAMAGDLQRALFQEKDRVEVADPDGRYRLVNNDCVIELSGWAENSVDLIVTSIPFSTQYEYTPSYNDFGHTDDNGHFWDQMRHLVGHLFRVLKPGRVAVIHIKDRIVPGGMTGLGFQTVYPFGDDCRRVFGEAGFAYIGQATNVTDVVRENNQTYRLGWSEQCKDGTRMGYGLPEYVLRFRRPPSDLSNGYADRPVVKPKRLAQDGQWSGEGYSRARWQLDAHGYYRSSGDRLLNPEELLGLDADVVYRTFRDFSVSEVYDYAHHVRVGETLDLHGRLPPTFMLLPPQSWHPDVWTDVAQMRSLNTAQAQKGAEKHLCPLPFDIVDRAIVQLSEPGELVLDPFAGLMTVPYRALHHGRRGAGIELNASYFADGVSYVRAMAEQKAMPSLFDFLDREAAA